MLTNKEFLTNMGYTVASTAAQHQGRLFDETGRVIGHRYVIVGIKNGARNLLEYVISQQDTPERAVDEWLSREMDENNFFSNKNFG